MQNEEYEKIIEKYRALYKRYKPIRCPHLENEEIVFNKHGFTHLIRKGKRLRPRHEVLERLALLPFASKIIVSKEAFFEHRIETNEGETIKYWGLTLEIQNLRVRVVIRKINNGLKHFYSIMHHNGKSY